jgi:hypothetical protein
MRERLAASYDLPFGMAYIRKIKFLRYVPFSPTYQQFVGASPDEECCMGTVKDSSELLNSKL